MSDLYEMQNDSGETFQMGLEISEVGKGDVIIVKGKKGLERIISISRGHYHWNSIIKTESGNYRITEIKAYGRKIK